MTGAVKLLTAGSGGINLQPASSIASDVTVNVPSVNGTLLIPGQASALTAGTAVASTSGTSIDFTGIPSWAKRITVMFNGVSLSGTSNIYVQLGISGGIQNTGYVTQAVYCSSPNTVSASSPTTAFFACYLGNAARAGSGIMTLSLLDAANNVWVESGTVGEATGGNVSISSGTKSLASALTTIRITTANGTDTFDAGSINILYE